MGIVNVTPDSFSDGGEFFDPLRAIAHAHEMVEQGAHIVDIGAESTRPGAPPVSVQQELDRLLPVLQGLRDLSVPISVDTMKPSVMRAAIAEGASMINDITAMQKEDAIESVRGTDVAVCLMHMQGDPGTMQRSPHYDDVVQEVTDFLRGRAQSVENSGINRNRIVVDPGFGFGKRSRHNIALLRELRAIADMGYPVLTGLSRKSILGTITGRAAPSRLAASLSAAILAVQRGAAIVRVHDVAQTRDALLMHQVLEDPENFLN